MTNLTLQPYSTKLAKHQPPDWRHPTENESASLRERKNEREEVTCFKFCNSRQQVTLHNKNNKKNRDGRRRERAVLTSRWSALECVVLARIATDIPTLPNRAQLSHATNRRVGEGKRGEEGSSLLPSPLSTVWNYKHYYFGEVLSRAEGGNRKY